MSKPDLEPQVQRANDALALEAIMARNECCGCEPGNEDWMQNAARPVVFEHLGPHSLRAVAPLWM